MLKGIYFKVESDTLYFEKRYFLTTFCPTDMAKKGAFDYAKQTVAKWSGNHKPIKVTKMVNGFGVKEWIF